MPVVKEVFLIPDDEDDDLDEPDGKQIENEYEFPPQFMTNVEKLETERYSTSTKILLHICIFCCYIISRQTNNK